MENPVVKAIILAVTIFMLGGVVAYSIWNYNTGTDATKAANKSIGNSITQMTEQTYAMYDNMEIKGSEVINAVKNFKEDGEAGKIGIKIATGENAQGTWYYNSFNSSKLTPVSTDISKLYDSSSGNSLFVNPNGTFKGTLQRDTNNTIRAIIFTQK